MARRRTYTDDELRRAISVSHGWRGVLRELSLVATSAGAMRSVRAYADDLALDYSHFRGQRRWTDDDLRTAVAQATSWTAVAQHLALPAAEVPRIKGHTARLGMDTSHLSATAPSIPPAAVPGPDLAFLNRAGSTLAAAWYQLCGWQVSWPLEPCRYDLLVDSGTGVRRVQVKTTTTKEGGSWKVYLSSVQKERRPYSPDEVDDFFIIDGELNYYLIPLSTVGGLLAIHLRSYESHLLRKVVELDSASVRCDQMPRE